MGKGGGGGGGAGDGRDDFDGFGAEGVPEETAGAGRWLYRLVNLGEPAVVGFVLAEDGVAITDHGNMGAVIKKYELAKKAGVKLIFGFEPYICKDIKIKDKDEKRFHLILLAKDLEGYKNLFWLSPLILVMWERLQEPLEPWDLRILPSLTL